jgi:hypothetical protein
MKDTQVFWLFLFYFYKKTITNKLINKETLCFVNGTYHISVNELDIPIDPKERYSNRIRYVSNYISFKIYFIIKIY